MVCYGQLVAKRHERCPTRLRLFSGTPRTPTVGEPKCTMPTSQVNERKRKKKQATGECATSRASIRAPRRCSRGEPTSAQRTHLAPLEREGRARRGGGGREGGILPALDKTFCQTQDNKKDTPFVDVCRKYHWAELRVNRVEPVSGSQCSTEQRGEAERTHLDTDVLLRLLLTLHDGLPDRARPVHDDVGRTGGLQRGQHQPESEPTGAEVHVKLVAAQGQKHTIRAFVRSPSKGQK